MTRLEVERFGGKHMSNTLEFCAHCGEEAKIRRREFSEQAYSALLAWGEIQESVVDQAICDHCYRELREVLIDRADDILNPTQRVDPAPAAVIAADLKVKKAAAAKKPEPSARPKVRKAG